MNTPNRRVIVATPESDCHVVALTLLEYFLSEHGYEVHNLGVCTPSLEIAQAAADLGARAVILSAQNGHAWKDLGGLSGQMTALGITDTPSVFIGGNLSVGANKDPLATRQVFASIGITVLDSFEDVLEVLGRRAEPSARGCGAGTLAA
jgi:methylaspartate mutase sigma subunit